MPVTFGSPFDTAFYTGTGVSSLVPGAYPIALNGRNYIIDTASKDWHRQSIPLVRNQADTGNIPGEQTINPEDLWRRAQDNWTHGAGQLYLDRIDPDVQTFHSNRASDNTRFHSSQHVNPWTRWCQTLLPSVSQVVASSNTNLYMVSVGSYLYYSDGTALKYVTTLSSPTPTTVTGTPGVAISSIASDGYNVWIACGASGIYKTTRGAAAATQLVSTAVDANTVLGYANGRLMVGFANSIYNVTNLTGPAALPTSLMDQKNTDFVWTAFTDGPGYIYASGWSGDKSLIYKIGITSDASSLTAPIVAAPIPDGEIARSVQGYLGYICIGTDKGVRFAQPDTNGNLNIGSIIPTTAPVYCFEPQDRFVWYGWTNYDSSTTGLGRLDLTQFTAALTPSYASDLQFAGQGTVQSLATFNSLRVFSVSGSGIYAETTTLESTGSLDGGVITFGLPDQKIGMYVDVRHDPLPAGASVQVLVAADRGSFVAMGTNTTTGSKGFTAQLSQLQAELFEVRIVLNRATDVTQSPSVTRVTMRAYPAPNRNQIITAPLMFYEEMEYYGAPFSANPRTELANIVALISNKRMVPYQEGSQTDSVFVDDYEWSPDTNSPTKDGTFFNGTCTVKMKIISQ